MAANDRDLDRTRIRIAWVITGVWLACFPLAFVLLLLDLPTLPVAGAQLPMTAVVGWLFAKPLIRRDDNGGP